MTVTQEIVYTRLLSENAGVSARQFQKLLMLFGSPSEICGASLARLAKTPGLGVRVAKAIARSQSGFAAMEADTRALAAQKIDALCFPEESYPSRLRALGDPPPLLFCRGFLPSRGTPSVAVAGPEDPTGETVGQAVRIGKNLAKRGVSIVTGPGKGVEASARVGALTAGVPSAPPVLVLSCGHEADLNDAERALAAQVEKMGALISEYPPRAQKTPAQEAASRRLVVALSQAVLVIGTSGGDERTEATFERAIRQGKPIFIFNPDPHADFPVGAVPLAQEGEIDLVVRRLV